MWLILDYELNVLYTLNQLVYNWGESFNTHLECNFLCVWLWFYQNESKLFSSSGICLSGRCIVLLGGYKYICVYTLKKILSTEQKFTWFFIYFILGLF